MLHSLIHASYCYGRVLTNWKDTKTRPQSRSRFVSAARESALVATFVPCNQLQAAQNRARPAADSSCTPFIAVMAGIQSYQHHLITGQSYLHNAALSFTYISKDKSRGLKVWGCSAKLRCFRNRHDNIS